jgi:acylphosphatase
VNNDLASLKATVYGRVQGVFFRAFVARHARDMGLAGYVRNLPDGAVEVWAEGDRNQLERLSSFLKEGPPGARVKEVVTSWAEFTGNFPDFRIRH